MQCVRVAPQISPELANPASGNQAVGIIVTEGFAERLEVALNSVKVGRALVQVVDALAPRLRVAERARLRARQAGLVVALVGARGGVRLRVRVTLRVRVGA